MEETRRNNLDFTIINGCVWRLFYSYQPQPRCSTFALS